MRTRFFRWRFSLVAVPLVLIGILVQLPLSLSAQESVLRLVRGTEAKADAYFADGSYFMAAALYEDILGGGDSASTLLLKVARCYYKLGNFSGAAKWFGENLMREKTLAGRDRLLYAEALAGIGRYADAAEQYANYDSRQEDNHWIKNKIWRLRNTHFLFEDSAQYSVRRLQMNSSSGEFGAVPYQGGLVFLSNRSHGRVVSRIDAASGNAFYKLMYAGPDTSAISGDFSGPVRFPKFLQSKYHNGPVCFYAGGKKIAYAVSSEFPNKLGERNLQIRFAEKTEAGWKNGPAFPFNGVSFSNSDPFVSEDGSEIYFSSDRPGGSGGKDLYRSVFRKGEWQSPQNLGTAINTPLNESSPFVFDNVLYFSSNGQPGLGGLDIFKAPITEAGFGDIVNMGYPVNTHTDDFGLVLLSGGYNGYFSSSRSAGTGDDIYELQIDQQRYPLVIEGVVKMKEHSWTTNDTLKILAGASLRLIDHTRNVPLGEAVADEFGRFSLNIPYFSFFRIRVVHPDGSEALVSFEIPRKKKEDYFHEIVIVRDAFKNQGGQTGYD